MEKPRTERHKEDVRRDWTDGAAGWRKWNAQFAVMTRAATEAIVEAAQVRPGMQVLDLASGAGEPALSLAEAVAPNGHVMATDLVPDMLAIAEENARARRLSNISFKEADAEAIPFADQTFDAVTSRLGVMFFPDAAKALQEIHRVLKPSGRAAFVAWGPVEQNASFMSTLGVLMKHVRLPPPDPDAPGPFRFAKAGSLSTALAQAGFQEIREESRTIPMPFPGSVEQSWESIRDLAAGPFRRLIEGLDPRLQETVVVEIQANLARYYDGHQVNLSAGIVLASCQRAR